MIFRIYRDTRFSKDLTPYKVSGIRAISPLKPGLISVASFFSCVVSPVPRTSRSYNLTPQRSRTGRKGPFACYYVHAEPGNCYVGGGLYHPENDAIHKIRESIDERPRRWRRILNEPGLKKHFLPSAGKSSNPEVALKAFAERNQDGALKVGPKVKRDVLVDLPLFQFTDATIVQGYNAEHRDIELLKLKNYVLGKKVPDSVVFGPGSQEKLAEIFRPMVPFVSIGRCHAPCGGRSS